MAWETKSRSLHALTSIQGLSRSATGEDGGVIETEGWVGGEFRFLSSNLGRHWAVDWASDVMTETQEPSGKM